MSNESAWANRFCIFTIVMCIGTIIGGMILGGKESAFLLYTVIACVIAAVEFFVNMALCELFENVNRIDHNVEYIATSIENIENLPDIKELKDFMPTFKKLSENVDAINRELTRQKAE